MPFAVREWLVCDRQFRLLMLPGCPAGTERLILPSIKVDIAQTYACHWYCTFESIGCGWGKSLTKISQDVPRTKFRLRHENGPLRPISVCRIFESYLQDYTISLPQSPPHLPLSTLASVFAFRQFTRSTK